MSKTLEEIKTMIEDGRKELFDLLLSGLPVKIKDKYLDRESKEELNYDQILTFEDLLGHYCVFINPHYKDSCDMFSYRTICQFDKLDIVFELTKDYFTLHQFVQIISYYLSKWYLSPMAGLLASILARKLNLPDPLNEANKEFYNHENN